MIVIQDGQEHAVIKVNEFYAVIYTVIAKKLAIV